MQLSLRNAVDAVDAVDKQSMNVNTVNSVYSDSEEGHPDEKITRERGGTPLLSAGEEWEEV